ncbi:hypothetical protein HYH02_003362 [Chlamydomonas schloesseri]|uniref:N-acetyltransferase domain-containing protein n=1 Tax=Chlamydomonas schloesseri TaxID=2026947 RepID=A0A835WQQ1_9CHLO|nr:hypothetical protein HYH02_003362 [Chlamydomonas schloesseri]|eukprot:KAG2452338.1 hypothetical protein HYH02_003362 [Chlamydomonas schloesseri]
MDPGHDCRYFIRQAGLADAREVALIFAESFGRGNFPGVQAEALDALETRYVGAIEREMDDKLREALEAKALASREHREFRLQQYVQRLRAQLAALRGEPARFPTQLSPAEERTVQRWRRARQFLVLVAEEAEAEAEAGAEAGTTSSASNTAAPTSTGDGSTQAASFSASSSAARSAPPAEAADPGSEAAGPGPGSAWVSAPGGAAGPGWRKRRGRAVAAASVSLMQPEALLPPPFPSNKPFRLYVSNMSVVPSHRRRGLARRLLQQCERVARLWGYESIWLHVKRSNTAAAALYASMGYTPVAAGGARLLPGPLSQVLMTKALPPLSGSCPVELGKGAAGGARAAGGGSSTSVSGSGSGVVAGPVSGVSGASRGKDGVFVWGAVMEGSDGAAESARPRQ